MTREFDFYRECLHELGLQTMLESQCAMERDFDYGLRKAAGEEITLSAFLDLYAPKEGKPAIVKVFDSLVLSYLVIEIPDDRLLVGPYASTFPTTEIMDGLAKSHGVRKENMDAFRKSYYRIPEIKDERALACATSVLMRLFWKDNWEIREHKATLYDIVSLHLGYMQDPQSLEDHYRNENLVIDAVMRGDDKVLKDFPEKVKSMNIAMRIPDPVRNLKNYAIILNTLLRKAAEKGGVSIMDVDRFSDRFARAIESCITIEKLLSVIGSIPYGYVTLVREKRESGYSVLVTKALHIMEKDMTVTLSEVANRLNVTPGWLSKCLSRETHNGFASLMMHFRSDFAGYLLLSGKKSMEEIAVESGFSDVSYFASVFHRMKGMTPSEWRRKGFREKSILSPGDGR